jgi:hypothetical protein
VRPGHNHLFQLLSPLPLFLTSLIRLRPNVWLISGERWRKAPLANEQHRQANSDSPGGVH